MCQAPPRCRKSRCSQVMAPEKEKEKERMHARSPRAPETRAHTANAAHAHTCARTHGKLIRERECCTCAHTHGKLMSVCAVSRALSRARSR